MPRSADARRFARRCWLVVLGVYVLVLWLIWRW